MASDFMWQRRVWRQGPDADRITTANGYTLMSCESNQSTEQDHGDLARAFVECGYVATALPPSWALIADLLGALEAAVMPAATPAHGQARDV